MKDSEKAKGGQPHQKSTGSPARPVEEKTLSDMGISKDQSSKWQKLADVEDKDFEKYLSKPGVLTTTGRVLLPHLRPCQAVTLLPTPAFES